MFSVVAMRLGCLDENWCSDSIVCYCHLQNVRGLLIRRENTLRKAIFGKPFNGRVIPFGSMEENHPILRKTSQDSINLVRQISSDMHWRILKRRYLGYRHGGVRKFRCFRNLCSETQCRGDFCAEIGEHIMFPIADGSVGEIREVPKIHLCTGSTAKRRRATR